MRRVFPILALAAVAAVIKFLPWWGSIAVLVGMAVLARLLAGRLLKGLLLGAFRAKGAALAGAEATLHALNSTEPPKAAVGVDGRVDGLEGGPLRGVPLDPTIHVPAANAGKTPFRLWDPTELRLVPVDTKSGPPGDDEKELATIAGVERYDEGR